MEMSSARRSMLLDIYSSEVELKNHAEFKLRFRSVMDLMFELRRDSRTISPLLSSTLN